MRTKILKAILYPLFFLLCLVFFLIRGFPVQLIGSQLTHQVESALGMKVTTGSMSTLFPNGLEVTEVRLLKEGEEGSTPMAFLIDRVSLRLSLLALLTGKTSLTFSSDLLAGKAEGSVSTSAEGIKVQAKTTALELDRVPIWAQLMGLNLAGKLNSSVELEISSKDIKETKGSLSLDLEQGKLGDGQVQVPGWGPLTIPWISLGKTEASFDIKNGKADVKTFKVASDDVDGTVDGYLLLQQKFSQISSRCKARFKISDDFLKRNPKFDILTSKLAEAKGKDGFYAYTVFGPISQPQFRPLKQ